MLEIAAESPASGARFVGKNWGKQHTPPKNQNPTLQWLDFTRTTIIYKPDFAVENEHGLKERQSPGLAETNAEKNELAKKFLCQKKWTWQKSLNWCYKNFG